MGALDLRPTTASAPDRPDWKTRALSVAIALLLVAGVGVAAVRTAGDPVSSVATAEDLQLIQSSNQSVQALQAMEMTTRFKINGQTTTTKGVGGETGGRFTVSVPGLDDFEFLQVGDRTYLPAFAQPGWSEFIGPQMMATEAADAIAGQNPLDYLRSISSTDEIEVLGTDSIDGADVTQYRLEISLGDALRGIDADAASFGLSEADYNAILADASPMRIAIDLDAAGIPRHTRVTYELQGIDFECENHIRPVESAPTIDPPPAGEIVSSHQADSVVHLQQLIGSHIAQNAMG